MHWSGLNSDLKHFLKLIFKEGGLIFNCFAKPTNKQKIGKMVKNKQSNLIASVKMLNKGVINKRTIN